MRADMTATVRFRVTALATLAALIVLVVAGIGLVVAERALLTKSLDDALRLRADNLGALVTQGEGRGSLGDLGDDDLVAQLVTVDGTVIAASHNLEGAPPVTSPESGLRTVADLPTDDERFRLLTRHVESPSGTVVVHVGAALDDIEESADALTTILLVAVPAIAAVLAALVWILVGRTLAPVEAIRAEVAEIDGEELHRRVPEPDTGDEIARLARTMNAMLDRVEKATERQQRFVADASHELRSPLTRIRSELEVDLAHPADADLAATHRSVLAEAASLQRLLDDLLQLARGAPARDDPVDLDDLVFRVARQLRDETRVEVETGGVSGAQVRGDADQLARVIRNLTANAVLHAGGTVTLTLAEQDGTAVLTVADDGPGIPPAEHERVFERFARLDAARTAGGAGLGLAITRDIVERHGGTVVIDPDHRPGTRVVVTLPASTDRD